MKKNMKKYIVNFYQTVNVEAKNKDDAESIAIKLWEDNEDFQDVRNMEIEIEEDGIE